MADITPDPVTGVDTVDCRKHGPQKVRQTEYRRPEAGGALLHLNCGDTVDAPVADFGPSPEELAARAEARAARKEAAEAEKETVKDKVAHVLTPKKADD